MSNGELFFDNYELYIRKRNIIVDETAVLSDRGIWKIRRTWGEIRKKKSGLFYY